MRVVHHTGLKVQRVLSEFLRFVGTYGSITNTENALTTADSSTYCNYSPAQTREGGPVFGFGGFSEIRDDAVIDSVSCDVKIRCSNGNGMTSGTIQLYAGDTAKGSAIDFANSTDTNIRTFSDTGSWTRTEIEDLQLRIYAQRKNNRNVYFYGSDLTVNCSYDEYIYTVNASSQSETVTVSPNTQEASGGNSATVRFLNVENVSEIAVEDNGDNVTSRLVHDSGTTYLYVIDDISADHNVVVKDVPAVYVTVTNNSSLISSTDPSSGTTVKAGLGQDVEIRINTNEIDHINIFDDDVKNNAWELKEKTDETTSTLVPGSYSDNTYNGSGTMNFSNGYTDTSSTTRVTLQAGTRNSTQSIYYNFDVSSVPQDAVILSVSCRAKICVSNTFSTTDTGIQLYSGEVTKSNRNRDWYNNTNAAVYDLANIDAFTREELSSARLKITGRTSTANRSVYFYGADLIVEYEYKSDVYYTYTSVADKTKTVRFETRPQYQVTASSQSSGDTISPASVSVWEGHDQSFSLSISDLSVIDVIDNETSVKSQLAGSNSPYTYTLSDVTESHVIVIKELSQIRVYVKVNGVYVKASRVYQKVSGSWQASSDPTSLFVDGKVYISGDR